MSDHTPRESVSSENRVATWALIFGIASVLSWMCIFTWVLMPVFGLTALMLGILGLRGANRSGTGKATAITGMILAGITVAFVAFAVAKYGL